MLQQGPLSEDPLEEAPAGRGFLSDLGKWVTNQERKTYANLYVSQACASPARE